MNQIKNNPYLKEVTNTLPRVLSLFDNDITSKSFGIGDRKFWAWAIIDFPNGTFQGAAHGLARLWKNNLWPYKTKKVSFLHRIDSIFKGTKFVTRKNGSLEETFPYESSFCVTALIAYDLLCTIGLLEKDINLTKKSEWLSIVKPMINFLVSSDETHGIISNHLMTASAALVRWSDLTKDQNFDDKAHNLLNRVLKHQSKEGWFNEYGGADPGYQSLCTYYLSDIYTMRPNWKIKSKIKKSINFIKYFIHPDGSFGGIYGSRSTRFYVPSGFLLLSKDFPIAREISSFMSNSIKNNKVVTLSCMDEPNLIPMFNSYCWAASVYNKFSKKNTTKNIPSIMTNLEKKHFPKSGIFIDKGKSHYTIINYKKGGVVYHFTNNKKPIINTGIAVKNKYEKIGSSQTLNNSNKIKVHNNFLIVNSNITEHQKRLPSTLVFIILRIMNVSILRVNVFNKFFKKFLVFILIKKKKTWNIRNTRKILLGNKIKISDKLDAKNNDFKIVKTTNFIGIHMASKSYWQLQDED